LQTSQLHLPEVGVRGGIGGEGCIREVEEDDNRGRKDDKEE
jgi:hypothetical protein